MRIKLILLGFASLLLLPACMKEVPNMSPAHDLDKNASEGATAASGEKVDSQSPTGASLQDDASSSEAASPQDKASAWDYSEEQWKQRLPPDVFHITRQKGTEARGTGPFLHHKSAGLFTCACCELPLFASGTKFDSGSGWPSFWKVQTPGNIRKIVDKSHRMVRTEIQCSRCSAHLGHVFDDGPRPTGLRYCVNSASLKFQKQKKVGAASQPQKQD